MRSRLMKALANRFHVKFMQLEKGLLLMGQDDLDTTDTVTPAICALIIHGQF